MSRGALALINIAVAATFFPTAAVLTGAQADNADVSVSPVRVAVLLREHCQRLEAQASDDPDLEEAELVEAWRELARISMSTFEGELRALGKRRIALPELRAAYLRAHPEALNAPDGRQLLLDALQALERDGVMELPRQGRDTSGSPELRRTAGLRVSASPRRPVLGCPALAFAAGERHPGRRADLQAINSFLVSVRERNPLPVPTKERSLQIFGDEKRRDQLRKGGSTLFDGRISLDDLECYPVAPPLPHETPERCVPGQPILVLENYHSFDSFGPPISS